MTKTIIDEEKKIGYQYYRGLDEEDLISEDQIEEPYDSSRIQVDTSPMTIYQIMRKIENKEIDLQPEFQRNIVWDKVRQSRLIESILINIPLPAFYLDALSNEKWLVVDGLQRLWTLNSFYNKKDLKLIGLEFLGNQLNGKTFDEISRFYQRRIEETYLHLYIIKPDTPSEVKFTIFYRINTGGMVLAAQEIRHSLLQGNSTHLLRELAESKEFLNATSNSVGVKRMGDRECVLRYLAFHLNSYEEYVSQDFNKFLSMAMVQINNMEDEELKKLNVNFKVAMNTSGKVFGVYAFRKLFALNTMRNPVNKSLFEIWSVCLEKFDSKLVVKKKDSIVKGYVNALNTDGEYLKSITESTGSVARVQKRFKKTIEIITEAIS